MLEHELERLKEAIALEDSGQGAPSTALALAQPAAPSKVCHFLCVSMGRCFWKCGFGFGGIGREDWHADNE